MRAVMRRAAFVVTAAAGASVLAAGMMVAGAGPAGATPAVLYAASSASGTGDCSSPADACDLTTALGDVAAGGTIELVTPGATTHYVGNWAVSTTGTSASAPVTIEPAPGVSNPTLDGNNGASTGCSTTSCNGPVLTVPSGEFVALSGITIANGNLSTNFGAGGLDNAGTVTITGSTFTGNTTVNDGGAIDNGNGILGASGGSVTVTDSAFTGNSAGDGGAIDNGDNGGTGTVTVTGSTFTDNTASNGGGVIENGSLGGGGTVTVTASTFTGNSGVDGGALDNGDGGGGTMTVTASTFSGNSGNFGGAINAGANGGGGTVQVAASTFSGNTSQSGGGINSGEGGGAGTVTVTASTFSGNSSTAGYGPAVTNFSGGTVQVAGDVFDGSCDQVGGTWTDEGDNAGTDTTCFASSPPASDTSGSAVGSDLQATLTGNGGPTETLAPTTGNPAIGLITNPTTGLCPATDQRGYASAAGSACDAGAVQTTGTPPALTLKDTAKPATFNAAGQVITYSYKVTNTGAGPLTGITVTDPAVPGVSCPSGSLAAGASQTCTGKHTTTSADLAARKITDTATATGTAGGVPVASNTSTVTVTKGWPPLVTGTHRPAAGAAEGYYLGATNNTWQLLVTHPGTTQVTFTGQISIPKGTLAHLKLINPTTGHQVTLSGKVITFTLPDSGQVTGFSFTTGTTVRKITFTLNIGGHPATASQMFLGGTPTHPTSGSPLTITR